MVKYYDDKQIQWLRENNSLNHSLVFWRLATIFYSPKYWYLKNSARVPVITSYSCTDAHSCTYTQARNLQLVESCKLSSLCPSTKLIESQHQPGSWLSLCNRACSKKIIAKSATQCQQKIIFHGNSWFVKCKVQRMQLLTWAEKKELICRSSGRLPWNSSR